ncbi:sigma-54-dependent transcriptional regulator [Oceanobacillus piezotolerans]|uniref:Sigma-54-dependent transcriptional regulator n=1 Tax=Oceanobacillus piezotolerans TaxID=2448030 RepID=A0A498DG05_9BACI|nr:sigma-54-dependent Fis family transcriptional regulator [Oceanobacillus piezotolerans]RLL48128.1 sigma-54-dependent transcriptional regulator [Oceanobacillus piezotolerans]
MKKVLIIGAGKGGSILLKIFLEIKSMEIIAIIDKNANAPGIELANNHQIPTDYAYEKWLSKADIIIEATGDKQVLEDLMKVSQSIVIPGSIAYIISELFDEKESLLDQFQQLLKNQELILSHIHDGMIIINSKGNIEFANDSALEMLGISRNVLIGKPMDSIISNTNLLNVLKTKEKEINQPFRLENGKNVITTRIPVINADNKLVGAFAVFKDLTEVIKLAEENTDLNEIKTMFEAIIKSSEEAISVVDEKGLGLMINPAYTRLTGLAEKEVIGKPATTDISEGESIHMKVLETKKSFRGVRMKVGPKKKDVIVNVAPVIVKGKVKGSIGIIHDVTEIKSLTKELKIARQIIRSLQAKYTFDDIIGTSQEMTLALEQAKVGAKTPAIVLLRGESGTGKELFAHAIHNESNRKHNKFIRVNCAAIAESILESELFGYEEGAFSGAKSGGKKGLFEEANHGSIFLDEIGELSLNMQAKLLRVLQENEIIRVGGTSPIIVDVRIIAATNLNLERAIVNKTFREDLYYRLNRLPIYIPTLKERQSDLPDLARHIIQKINQDYGRNVQDISEGALAKLQNYDWPGNVRELENILGRTMIYMGNNEEIIESRHIPQLELSSSKLKTGKSDSSKFPIQSLQQVMEQSEKDYIQQIYMYHDYNKTKTAETLKISIRNLYYKLEKYNLE